MVNTKDRRRSPRIAGMLLELMVPGDGPVRSFGRAAGVREPPDLGGYEVGGRCQTGS